jgi:hypothetical protein
MAGNTSRIDIETLKLQWASHSSYAALCSFWTVTREQVIRLKHVIPLPPRHDRRLRHRPSRDDLFYDPPPEEVAASEASLNLSPLVAARATCESSLWSDEVRAQRQVRKPTAFSLTPVDVPGELRGAMDDGVDR